LDQAGSKDGHIVPPDHINAVLKRGCGVAASNVFRDREAIQA